MNMRTLLVSDSKNLLNASPKGDNINIDNIVYF